MPLPAQPEVPLNPPPIIVAPQNGDLDMQDFSGPPQEFQHRRPRKLPH
jgi:hypothetical protein